MKLYFIGRYIVRPVRQLVVFSTLMLVGCAEFNSGFNQHPAPYNGSYGQTDFDELLAFGENMAKMPTSARAKQCRSLQKREKTLTRTGIVLHLMVGRLLSEGCGDISKLLFELNAIPPGSLDARTQKLVAIDTVALERINGSPRKSVSTDCKQKTKPSEAATKTSKGSSKNETRLLREKLEAIRSMEKQIDESGEAK